MQHLQISVINLLAIACASISWDLGKSEDEVCEHLINTSRAVSLDSV